MALYQWVFVVLWLGACAYALARGGSPERIVATAFMAGAVLTRVVGRMMRESYGQVATGVALVDGAMLCVIMAVALLSARFWPMLMASMQSAELLGHLAKELGRGILPQAYYATVFVWSIPMLLLLATGTWRHRARLDRYGVDPAWSRALPSAYRAGASADEADVARAR